MRLIDADALMRIYEGQEFCSDYVLFGIEMGDAVEILNNAPTVEAIPVEFIRSYMEKIAKKRDACSKGGLYWRYWNDIRNEFDSMLSEWEERKEG